MKTKLYSLVAASILIAAGGCGGTNEGEKAVSPAAGASPLSTGKAASSVSDVVLSSALRGSGNGSSQVTTAKSLTAKTLAKATGTLEVSFTESADCHSGSGSENGRLSGSVTADDTTGVVTSLVVDITLDGTLTNCAEADDPETTDFDESKLLVSGSYTGDGRIELRDNQFVLPLQITGNVTVGGEACPAGGSLSFNLSCDATSQVPLGDEDADFSGTAGGSLSGNVCGVPVDCTLSGDCEEPKVSGIGCE